MAQRLVVRVHARHVYGVLMDAPAGRLTLSSRHDGVRGGRQAADCAMMQTISTSEAPMSDSEPQQLVAGFYKDFDSGDIDAALRRFSGALETIDPGLGTVHGADAFREYLQTFKRAMPDARAIVESLSESAGTVTVEGRFLGTHTGPLAGDDGDIPATGRAVDLRFADVARVVDGAIVSYHTYYDQLGLLTQLGLMNDE
jgi:steroid delta-isomerase-like uncharacterized protein